jgi:hypothetical protein
MKKDANVSRRKFLAGGAGTIVGGAIAGSVGGAILRPVTANAAPSPLGYLPKPPYKVPIDQKAVVALAFRHYNLSGG